MGCCTDALPEILAAPAEADPGGQADTLEGDAFLLLGACVDIRILVSKCSDCHAQLIHALLVKLAFEVDICQNLGR